MKRLKRMKTRKTLATWMLVTIMLLTILPGQIIAEEMSGGEGEIPPGGLEEETFPDETEGEGGEAGEKDELNEEDYEIISFEALSHDIRFQNTPYPEFPEEILGTFEGESEPSAIPVSWESQEGYNKDNPQSGFYVFKAILGGGYSLAGGLELPKITVYIPKAPSNSGKMNFTASPESREITLEIITAQQLAEIAALVNSRENGLELFLLNDKDGKVILKLMNDIDLSYYGKNHDGGKGWIPIGSNDRPFKGDFSGNGHIIKNLYINRPNEGNGVNVGFIGVLDKNSKVSKLGIIDANIRGYENVGIIAGSIGEDCLIEACFTQGKIEVYRAFGGGIIGKSLGGSITNSYSGANFNIAPTGYSVSYIGGLLGALDGVKNDTGNTITVKNSYSTGSLDASGSNLGGLVGSVNRAFNNNNASIKNSIALNPQIKNTLSVENNFININRILGYVSKTTELVSNYAYSDIIVYKGNKLFSINDDALNNGNGLSVSAHEISSPDFFENIFGQDNSAWIFEDGKLPILSGFGPGVQSNKIPDYIIDNGGDANFKGSGSQTSPFLIESAEDLKKLADLVNSDDKDIRENYNTKQYRLTNDIDLSDYGKDSDFNDGKGWIPIGESSATDFQGHFNGDGHIITGLYINDETRDNAGLFGCVNQGYPNFGSIKSLGLVDVDITGHTNVGSIVGTLDAGCDLEDSYASGKISGGEYVGGLAGSVYGEMQNSFMASGIVTADRSDMDGSVGGIGGYVSREYALLENCYAFCQVISDKDNWTGGIAGYAANGASVKNCIALNPKIEMPYNEANGGRVIGYQSQQSGTFEGNYAFDGMKLIKMDKVQTIADGAANNNNGQNITFENLINGDFPEGFKSSPWTFEVGKLPGLFGKAQDMPDHLLAGSEGNNIFSGGGESEEDPYLIYTAEQLKALADLVNSDESQVCDEYNNKHYKLMNDIDLSAYGKDSDFNDGKGWDPIGNMRDSSGEVDYYKYFSGSFEGNNKTITGLYINRPGEDYIGLFGYMNLNTAKVENLSLKQVHIFGKNNVGSISGMLHGGTVSDCLVEAVINGSSGIGGITGGLSSGLVKNCSVQGSIEGFDSSKSIGGIVGSGAHNGKVKECYSVASVSGLSNIGGIAGSFIAADSAYTDTCITDCYNIGNIQGEDYLGGIIGFGDSTSIKNSYNAGQIIVKNTSANGVGGIVGYMSNVQNFISLIENCAALDPSMGNNSENIGRIAGDTGFSGDSPDLRGNYAYKGMLLNNLLVEGGNGTNKNGEDLSLSQINSKDFWEDIETWVTEEGSTAWSDEIWTFENEKLPVLKNTPGQQPGLMPLYLLLRDIQYADVRVENPVIYPGTGEVPDLIVTFDTHTLVEDVDYKAQIISVDINEGDNHTSEGINAGEVTLKLTGMGDYIGEKSDFTYTIEKADQSTFSGIPRFKEKTETSITLDEIPDCDCEYGICNDLDKTPDEWQDETVFTNLYPKTEYYLYARLKGDNNYKPSNSSEALSVSTPAARLAGNLSMEGALKFGQTLTVNTDLISSDPAFGDGDFGEFEFSWYRGLPSEDGGPTNSELILGVNSASYNLSKDDIGKYISVVLTAPKYCDGFLNFDSTDTVQKAEGLEAPTFTGSYSNNGSSITYTINITNPIPDVLYEYDMDGNNAWQLSNKFENILPNTDHFFRARAKESETHKVGNIADSGPLNSGNLSDGSGGGTVPMIQPNAPTLTGNYTGDGTTFTYTIKIRDPLPGESYEYSMDSIQEGVWRDSNIFEGIEPLSMHTFYARIKETNTHLSSEAGVSGPITFNKLNNTSVPVLSYTLSESDFPKTITIKKVDGGEYRFNDGDYGSDRSFVSQGPEDVTLYIRYKETGTHLASHEAETTINTAHINQDPPGAFSLKYKIVNGKSYIVTIPESIGAEYSFDGVNWGSENTISGILPGESVTGYKRMAPKPGYNPSSSVSDILTLPIIQDEAPEDDKPNGGDPSSPSILTLIATPVGNGGAFLEVTASGPNGPFTYQWQVKGSWIDIPGATSSRFDYSGLDSNTKYTVRVKVTDSKGNIAISPEISFTTGAAPITRLPKKQTVEKGKSITLSPTPPGGVFEYDEDFFTMKKNGNKVIFTARKVGTSSIKYIVDGTEFITMITIDGASIPKTGDDSSFILYLVFCITALGAIASLLWIKKIKDAQQ